MVFCTIFLIPYKAMIMTAGNADTVSLSVVVANRRDEYINNIKGRNLKKTKRFFLNEKIGRNTREIPNDVMVNDNKSEVVNSLIRDNPICSNN